MSLVRGALQPGLSVVKKTAPFYSAVDDALAAIKRPKGTGAEFYTELTKQPGVKKAELADRKLEQAFKAKGKMTKEEAQQILKENPPPKLKEKVLDESQVLEEDELKDLISQEMYGKPYDEVYNQGDRSRVFDEAMRRLDEGNGPIYGDYQTPGGENYREILLKLPVFNKTDARRIMELEANLRRGELPANQMQELVALQAKKQSFGTPYYSSHWKEDPNVLAHMRVQDRTGPNGEKILHVEEIQSDWHQEGRKKGYRNEEAIGKAKQAFTDYSRDARERMRQLMLKEAEGEMAPDRALRFVNQYVDGLDDSAVASFLNEKPTFNNLYRATKDAGSTGVPDAPFKKNWHELAMKRLLNYAADNGYDSIAITPGAEQAKRYDLSKQVDELLYKQNPDGTFQLSAQARGRGNMIGQAIPAEKLEDYVGKDVAQKIIDNRGTERNLGGSGSVSQPQDVWGSLSGEGLQVGGEGMKGFYDQILPSYLNTFGKPYGAQVGILNMPSARRAPPIEEVQRLAGINQDQWRAMTGDERVRLSQEMQAKANAEGMSLHSFPITPEMRESIKQKGLPLYQQIGIPTAGAGAASQMPQQMQEPELEPEVKKADGGAINYNTAPDMSDGGRIIQGAPFKRGGKVNMTTNPDAMFMELSNKKLKRK